MYFILLVIAVYVLAPMVIGPFLIKSRQWVAANADINPVLPETLDPEMRAFLDKAKGEFESIGFDFVDYMSLVDYMPEVTSYFALFTDKQSRLPAMAAAIRNKSGKTIYYCEFSSKYTNGSVINVNNSPMMGSFVHPHKSSYRYPAVTSVRQLHDINKWITSRDTRAVGPVGSIRGRELDTLVEALNGEIKLQEHYGYFTPNRDRTRYLFTWKGAFLMTEKNVFPIKHIRTFLDQAAAKKAIAGMPSFSTGPIAAERIEQRKPDVEAYRSPVQAGARSGEAAGRAAALKIERQFKNGANWFFWIAALSLINSMAMKVGSSWHFIVGLGITRFLDAVARTVHVRTNAEFQAVILFMDVCFPALFAAFGLAALKRSSDGFVLGMILYGLDALLLLLVFDVIGIVFHVIALIFLLRGWAALKKMPEMPAA